MPMTQLTDIAMIADSQARGAITIRYYGTRYGMHPLSDSSITWPQGQGPGAPLPGPGPSPPDRCPSERQAGVGKIIQVLSYGRNLKNYKKIKKG